MTCIIVEGPDGAGKTTLIEALRAKQRWSGVDHHGAYLDETAIARHYLASLYAALVKPKRLQLMDRSWIAEPIYGAVMRGGLNRIQPYQLRMLNRVAMGVSTVVVLCLPPFEACEAAWKDRLEREYPQRAEQLRMIYDGYSNWFEMVKTRNEGAPVILYDYTRYTDARARIEQTIAEVIDNSLNLGPGIGACPGPVYGDQTLLIGDEVSEHGHARLPFVSMTRSGCSAWLADQLDKWDVHEGQLYWVNQAELHPDDFHGTLDQFKRIVALGGNAAAWCEQEGFEHIVVPHPQYWKRFNFNKPYPLREVLAP